MYVETYGNGVPHSVYPAGGDPRDEEEGERLRALAQAQAAGQVVNPEDNSGSSAQAVDPATLPGATDYIFGDYNPAALAADRNIGSGEQVTGSLNGYNLRVLQELQRAATRSQYEYLERLSSTAYSRAVQDMKRAGLNPAVMFAGGSGSAASTPQVGIASVASKTDLASMINSAMKGISSLGSLLALLF